MGIKSWIFGGLNAVMFVILFLLLDAQGATLITRGAWEYKDLVAVLLTVVSIIITFIGIIVALAAIWGYQSIRTMAEQKAVETSKAGCDTYLVSPEFREQLSAAIKQRIEAEAKEAVQNALAPVVLYADDSPEHQAGDEEWRD